MAFNTACGNGFPLNIGGGGNSAEISELESAVQALQGVVGDSEEGLVKDVSDLQTAVGDNDSGLIKDVADIQTALENLNPNIYSTTETAVGKWNNNDLYRKIVNIGSLPNNSSAGIDSGITNLGDVVSMRGYAKDSASIINLPYASPTSNDSISMWYDIANNKIFVNTKNDKSNFTGYVVIEYTKVSAQTNKGGKK